MCCSKEKENFFYAFFLLLLLDLGFFPWMVDFQQALLEADLLVLCVLHICSLCPAAGTWRAPDPQAVLFLEGWGGQGEEWRMRSQHIGYLGCVRRVQCENGCRS